MRRNPAGARARRRRRARGDRAVSMDTHVNSSPRLLSRPGPLLLCIPSLLCFHSLLVPSLHRRASFVSCCSRCSCLRFVSPRRAGVECLGILIVALPTPLLVRPCSSLVASRANLLFYSFCTLGPCSVSPSRHCFDRFLPSAV